LLTGLREDVVYAFRQIRRRPGLALVIILSLGGAMGVSTSLRKRCDTNSSGRLEHV
jgi:hypothetical protein